MRRREFIAFLGAMAVAWPRAVCAEQPDRMRVVGVLMAFAENDQAAQSQVAAFRGALAKLGWTQGRNAAKPLPIGSDTTANTIGIVRVSHASAAVTAVV
jgi:hypothetical protein